MFQHLTGRVLLFLKMANMNLAVSGKELDAVMTS